MTQARGVLPRDEDREILYHNARTCGYFVGVKLDPTIDETRLEALLDRAGALVDSLVARVPVEGKEKGDKVAAVALGFAPSFFVANGVARFPGIPEPPASFDPGNRLPNQSAALAATRVVEADVMFYIASVFEARVNAFVSDLAKMRPDISSITMDRGYQRLDDTEPFGYLDGVRNIVPATARSKHVFVHRDDRDADEPEWAEDGTYMAYMKILQHPEAFAALSDDNARDAVIGRRKNGSRLDRAEDATRAKDEPPDVPAGLPAASHVRKAGPRGPHDDMQIFRRGLPFIETTADGQVRVGLNFCSFQASLEQFDTMFNGWMMESRFPADAAGTVVGTDALLDPAQGLTTFEKVGFFFVPPSHPGGLKASLIAQPPKRKPTTGRLMVRKRVEDQSDPQRRFELAGFTFQVLDSGGQPVGAPFDSDATGRAVCLTELTLGTSYTLQELTTPLPGVAMQTVPFQMDKPNKSVRVTNVVPSGSPYGMTS